MSERREAEAEAEAEAGISSSKGVAGREVERCLMVTNTGC